eukprot:TRINITY_DN15421_c0_g1_i1.p1 TRINITY_DN15421_c0_g1~~TRINITY_DN15421_c0_g1_i1.p1  ORF type:complete len:411 (+),score=90.51 TRINITY_DN15421_c0_g1_i1:38-1270(+)
MHDGAVAAEKAQLHEAVVVAVLSALPCRLVPSRSFMSACFELVQSLIDAWLAAHDASAASGQPVTAGEECTQAWWEDASERTRQARDPQPTKAELLLALILERGRAGLPRKKRVETVADGAWPHFGASWVLAALDDAVGSVTANVARKAAGPAPRPGTAGSSLPITASPPGTRPPSSQGGNTPAASSGGGRLQFRPPSRAGAGTSKSSTAGPAKQAPEKYRLLSIKHFVVAAKADEGLQTCPVIETCLTDVATGTAPYIEAETLLAMQPYRERLLAWAAQESQGQGPQAVQQAVQQAMKCTVASLSQPPAGQRPAAAAPADRSQPFAGGPQGTPASAAGRGSSSWLPKAFVKEFNAEGDEVDPASDEELQPEEVQPAQPAPPQRGQKKKPTCAGGSAGRVVISKEPELLG